MKNILIFGFLLFLLVSSPGWSAEPVVLTGDFEVVTQGLDIESARRTEIVVTLNSEGQARLRELMKQGYACEAVTSSEYSCSKFVKDLDNIALALLAQFRKKWVGFRLSLREPVAAPELVYNSEIYKQWNVEQKALVTLPQASEPKVYSQCVYSQTQDVWKLYLGQPNKAEYYFLITKNREFEIFDTFILHENDRAWHTVAIRGFLDRSKKK